jgi:putative membrane protein
MRTSKWLTFAALALGLATLFACERKDDGYRSSGSKNRSTEPRGMSGTSWLQQAAEANLAEIDAGRLAGSKSTNNDVKQFGLHMVEDHSKANIDLTELAVKKGITLPTRPDEKHTKAAADLADLSGAEFDKKYADMMVADHEQAVGLFEANGNSSDADVKAFADKTLPTLKHHLQMARDLKGKVGTPKAD